MANQGKDYDRENRAVPGRLLREIKDDLKRADEIHEGLVKAPSSRRTGRRLSYVNNKRGLRFG